MKSMDFRFRIGKYKEENQMNDKMFCFQCEQTAGCSGCTGRAGVCGKKADTAELQDKLTGALIGLARATEGNGHLVTAQTGWCWRGCLPLLPM